MSMPERILVLKFGALGDFVQAFAAFAPIRRAHSGAHITLLTTPPFEELARASNLFDSVETDGRPRTAAGRWALISRLRTARYDRVYDLQTSGRSTRLFYWLAPRLPEWSGIAWGGRLRQTRADRNALHNLDRMADQLFVAGIAPAYPIGQAPAPDLSWASQGEAADQALLARFGLKPPFALLAPGASAVKPEKLWPVERYAQLAAMLAKQGYQVAVVGGPTEGPAFEVIQVAAQGAVDLTGKTSLLDLARLGVQAALAVGNDSGPTHMLAYAGAPGAMLMSRVSDPAHCAPKAQMLSVRRDDLADLAAEEVLEACRSSAEAARPRPAAQLT
jgi:ADP-heptose:LPS heptosyltransferase